jgi:ubiquitin C-terminal hydrolase
MPDDYVKCKSSDSRKLAYRILALLVRNDPTVYAEVVRDALTEVITQIPVTNSLNHKPTSEIKSYHGYVGIRNLGCICYMNAMIQQFYMTPAFRYAILLAEDGKSPQMTLQKNRDGTESLVDDNVIHQF